jgi:hypothetical protein
VDYRKEGCGSPIFIYQSKNVTVEGLLARNGRSWNCRGSMSDRVRIRNCKIVTPPACMPEWTDGYNFCSCQDLLIENCFAFCNDDGFASGHYFPWPECPTCRFPHDRREQKNYAIRGLLVWNPRANGIRIG